MALGALNKWELLLLSTLSSLFISNHRDVSTQAEEIKQTRGVFAKNRETRRGSWASPELITNDFSHLRLAICNCQYARLFLYSVLLSPLSSVIIPSNKNRKNLRFLLNQPHRLCFAPGLSIRLFCGMTCTQYPGTQPAWGFPHCLYGFWPNLIS